MRNRRAVSVVAALGLLITGVGGSTALAGPGDPGPGQTHRLGDDAVDTPLEVDAAQETAESHDEQHGGAGGHLPASSKNMELVGKLAVSGGRQAGPHR